MNIDTPARPAQAGRESPRPNSVVRDAESLRADMAAPAARAADAAHGSHAAQALEAELQRLVQCVPAAVQVFQRNYSEQTASALRELRQAMVKSLLTAPAQALPALWPVVMQAPYQALLASGLRDLPRTPDEEALLQALLPMLQAEELATNQPGVLAACMLLAQNYELPLCQWLERVPAWQRPLHLAWLLEPVGAHNRVGDAERCAEYLCRLTDHVHAVVVRKTVAASKAFVQELGQLYVSRSGLIQAYFCLRNTRSLYLQRGEIFTAVMVQGGLATLHARAPRRPDKAKRASIADDTDRTDAGQPPTRRIRLGVFAQHYGPQTETFFTLSHIDQIDRTKFEVVLYAGQLSHHPMEELCKTRADQFVLLPPALPEQAQRIRNDALDILLISTNMSVQGNTAMLLGSMRLAPLQLASVSTPVSTGAAHTDVMLSCEWNEPQPDAAQHYTEHLVRMPGSVNYYAYQYDTEPASIRPTRAALGVADDAIVLFSGANFYKIIPEQSLAWIRILAAVPNSVLVLMPFNPNWDSSYKRQPFMARLRQQMHACGVDPSRLKTVEPVPTRADVHRVIALADVYLDPFPFSGACSLLDPIIVGVPVVVRSGPVGRSNHAASLMQMLGLEELICDSLDAYMQAAVRMATDPALRLAVRQRLQAHTAATPCTYLDTALFGARVGQALQSLYAQQQQAQEDFCNQAPAVQRQSLQRLADTALGHSQALQQLTDSTLITELIEPFFHALPAAAQRHVVDVGACYGSMSAPLLSQGWTADLFEPDPAAHAVLARNMTPWGQQVRLHASAVSDSAAGTVLFHQAQSHGLSGLGASPFASTGDTLVVPSTRLADFYVRQGISGVDLLKIDAEGYDFDVLETHDFGALLPRLVMVEYGTHFQRQTVAVVDAALARMAARGYSWVVFNCTQEGDFSKGQWLYRTTQVLVSAPLAQLELADAPAFGNIVFYQQSDIDFVLCLRALFESCTPAAQRYKPN